MLGLVPGIHVLMGAASRKTWMAGMNPAMTGQQMTNRLFVYGTLMRGYPHRMADELARHATYEGRAAFRGRLYLVKTYPGIVASDGTSDLVHGDVYALRNADYLQKLDSYEGCGPDAEEPAQYRRAVQQVTMDGTSIDAWIYLYNGPVEKLTQIHSGRFSPRD